MVAALEAEAVGPEKAKELGQEGDGQDEVGENGSAVASPAVVDRASVRVAVVAGLE